jgi:hypothetical protein
VSDIVDNLKKFVEIIKAREALKKSSQTGKLVDSNKDLVDRLHKALHAGSVHDLPKTEKVEKKVLIRPDVVSKPETFNEDGKSVNRPSTVSGPTPMNVRKAEPLSKPWKSKAQARWGHSAAGKKALGGKAAVHEWDEATHGKSLPEKVGKGQLQGPGSHDEVDMGNYVNHDIQLSDKSGDQLYHIKDGGMRVTTNPMSLKDIAAKHGPIQKLESAGFKIVPHEQEPAQTNVPSRRPM